MTSYSFEDLQIGIDESKCTGCEECVMACPVDVFVMVEGKSTAKNISECIECMACVNVCPVDAISHSSC